MIDLYLIFILALLLYTVYLYATKNHDYWIKHGIKGPKPVPFFGNFHENFYNDPIEIEVGRYRKYGRIYGYFVRNNPIISVGDPEILRHIMVKDWINFRNRSATGTNHEVLTLFLNELRDETWKKVRSVVRPPFSKARVNKMFTKIICSCEKVLSKLDEHAKTKTEVDVKHLMGAFAMDAIASCGFGLRTDGYNDPKDVVLHTSDYFFQFTPMKILSFMFLPMWLLHLNHFSIFSETKFRILKKIFIKLIKGRENSKQEHDDFLQALINSRQQVKDNYNSNKPAEKALTDEEILGQMTLFLVTGFEVPNLLLIFLTYFLATNPNVQEKLFAEVNEFMKRNNNELTSENLSELKYVNATILETLRFYTPVVNSERQALHDYKLGNTGFTVPAGMIIRFPLVAIHRDPEFHPEPEVFRPERFLPENIEKIKPYTYMPFGTGPRNCIGMNFSLFISKILLTKMVYNYRFLRSPSTPDEIKFRAYKFADALSPISVICKVEKRLH